MLVRGTVLSIFLCASTAKRPVAPPHALERLQKCEASRCSELALTGSREASSKLTSGEEKAVMGALDKMDGCLVVHNRAKPHSRTSTPPAGHTPSGSGSPSLFPR